MSLHDNTIVVVDVLRASTTIATGLCNGAREFIPTTTVESAVKISGNLFGGVVLLGGERNGRMIEGFHLGNSPVEYSGEKVKGKTIVFSSTNGSMAMVKARYAREMFVCGFVNISVVYDCIKELGADFTVLCAGKNGMFSIEDSVCAGMLVHKLVSDSSFDVELSDGALAALTLYKSFGKNIQKMIKGSEHGKYLAEIGFGEDLKVCASVDTVPVVPQLVGNVVKLKRDAESNEVAKVPVSS
ncbi:MAG: 2-phosphosulfolactate phosphatase [Ignavibacteriae bacterium]|nr:2-phosphosulfolactate phosphatase [Ignavibacteriota bacterium]